MKKILSLLAMVATVATASDYRSSSILNPSTFGPYLVTNALCSVCYTTALYGGLKITNGASAPLGGFTNTLSLTAGANQTNASSLSWTNHNGIYVIVTNNVPGTVSGLSFVTNDNTPLVQDIDLPVGPLGQTLGFQVATNTNVGWGELTLSPHTLSIRCFGDASAATTLNLVFAGLPDGVNEVTGANGTVNTFQWGVVPISGTLVVSTNFPIWRFAGCKKLRLRSATLSTATAANIGVTIQALNFNGIQP